MVQVLQYILLVFFIFNNKDVFCKKHGSRHSKANDGKIVGGYNTTIQDVPYQVYLILKKQGKNEYFSCGGSIVNAKTVLTAAHCLNGMEMAFIRIGSSDSDSGGSMYMSRVLVKHPQYNSQNSDYDVGIIKLARSMNLDGTSSKAATLAESGATPEAGTELLVSGWGATSEGGSSSKVIMAVKVPVVSNQDCRKSYSYVSPRMICAGQTGKDSCQGDSGGPAVSQSTGAQVGVVSFGIGCARPNYPGVYASVADPSIRNFIRVNSVV